MRHCPGFVPMPVPIVRQEQQTFDQVLVKMADWTPINIMVYNKKRVIGQSKRRGYFSKKERRKRPC
jgi:hypothetical protein